MALSYSRLTRRVPLLACPVRRGGRVTSLVCPQFVRGYNPGMPLPQPHRKLVNHFDERGEIHELTFSCHHRWPNLDDEWFAGNADVTSY